LVIGVPVAAGEPAGDATGEATGVPLPSIVKVKESDSVSPSSAEIEVQLTV
jgi:hypothetical protein